MPNRIIRESCRTSPTLDQLSDGAERLFWRLITIADDYGRFEAHPAIVASLCFPLRAHRLKIDTVAKWLSELERCEHVRTYASSGKRYGIFLKFQQHQGPARAKTSKFPDPPANICEHLQTNECISVVSESVSVSENRIRESYSGTCPQPSANAGEAARPSGNGRRPFPPELSFTKEMREWANAEGCTEAGWEFDKFRDYHVGKGSQFKDWMAAWRNWVRKSIEIKEHRANGSVSKL